MLWMCACGLYNHTLFHRSRLHSVKKYMNTVLLIVNKAKTTRIWYFMSTSSWFYSVCVVYKWLVRVYIRFMPKNRNDRKKSLVAFVVVVAVVVIAFVHSYMLCVVLRCFCDISIWTYAITPNRIIFHIAIRLYNTANTNVRTQTN